MNCDKNFKKGLLAGGLLAGVLVAFGMSKKGKNLQKKVLESSQELYGEVKKVALEWGETTRESYNEIVERAAEEFARRKEMARDMKDALIEKLQDKWGEFQLDMLFGKVKNRFKSLEEKSKEGFEKLVHEIVDEYEKHKDLGGFVKYRLVRDLKRKWDELEAPESEKKSKSSHQDEGWR
jgi:gas vesicle protein